MLANFISLLGGRGAALAANLFWMLTAAKLYSPKEAALIAFASLAGSGLEAIKGLGLGNVMLRELAAADGIEAAGRIRTYFTWTTAALVPASCALWWLGPILRPEAIDDTRLWTLALLVIVIQSVTTGLLLALQARGRFREQAGWSLAFSVAQRALPAAIAVLGALSFPTFLNLTAALGTLCLLPAGAEAFRWMRGGRTEKFREFWPRSRHYYGGGLLRFAATQMDQLGAAVIVQAEVLAPYLLMRRLYSLVVVFLEACFDSMIPVLSRRAKENPESAHRLQEQMRELISFTATFAAVGAAANSRLIDPVLVPLFAVSFLGFTLYASALVRENVLGDPARALRCVAAAAASNLVAIPLLAPLLGGNAPAAALAFSLLLGSMVAGSAGPRSAERLATIVASGLAAYHLPIPFANAILPVWLLLEFRHPAIHQLAARLRARALAAGGAA